MQQIENLGENIELKVSDEILHKGNEAELFPVIINYKENIKGIIKSKQKDFLLRNCIVGDKSEHNKEIKNIYDTLISINEKYKVEKKDFKLNIINHLTDSDGNIYIKNILTKKTFNVYDLMPDSFYIDPEKKDCSKFNEFKESVNELKLNKIYIITKLFEQLAILHANNFVVGNIKIGDNLITHPTLSLFLYRLKNKKGNINEEIFIHDIHNLKLLENPKSNDYINHCISDLKDLAFDIIRFFKGIGLPQGGFITYAKVLRQLNPELYSIVYRSFLWDPKIEIEIGALEKSMSENKKHQKTSSKVLSELETFKNDKIEVINSLFRKNDLFFLAKSKQKIIDFLNTINPDNTEIIIDFDNTITYPGSSNSLNVGFGENSEFNENINYDEFFLRMGSISFLKLLLMKGYKVKIYSLGLTEIISKVLELNGLSNKNIEIFANTKKDIKYSKKDIEIKLDDEKRKIIIGDDLVDFELVQSNNNSLKIGFLNENLKTKMAEKKLQFNGKTDFYFSNQKSNFDILYELFKQL